MNAAQKSLVVTVLGGFAFVWLSYALMPEPVNLWFEVVGVMIMVIAIWDGFRARWRMLHPRTLNDPTLSQMVWEFVANAHPNFVVVVAMVICMIALGVIVYIG